MEPYKPEYIQKMFDKIAPKYDFMNNIISLFLHKSTKKKAVSSLKIKNGDKVLDLCSGTGDISYIVSKIAPNAAVVGADFSAKMIEIAQKKYPNLDFIQTDATDLIFENNSFDFVISTFGLRNVPNRSAFLSEVRRVLKSGGKFLQLDFSKNKVVNFFFDIFIKLSAISFSNDKNAYNYLIETKNKFLTPNELAIEFEKAGFKNIKIYKLLFNMISYQIAEK